MSFRHGKNTAVLVDQYNISPFLNEVSSSQSIETADTSTFGTAAKTYVVGQNDATISFTGLFDGATDAIVNITSGTNITLFETEQAIAEIRNATDKDLNIIYGSAVSLEMNDEMVVTVIATGYELKGTESGLDIFDEVLNNKSDHQLEMTQSGLKSVDQQEDKKEGPKIPSWLKKKGSL